MIEVWRQCVTAVGTTVFGAAMEYFLVGAFRGGGEVREVRLRLVGGDTSITQFYLAWSSVGVADAAAFEAATPFLQGRTVVRHLGKPGWIEGLTPYYGRGWVWPCAMHVDTGGRWLMVALQQQAAKVFTFIATVTVIGFDRSGVSGA